MPLSTYAANKILEHQVGKTSWTMPTNVYVALSSTTPTIGNTNVTEPSGGAYARVQTTGAVWGTAAAGSMTNASTITFPAATADWLAQATLTYAVIYDAASAGNMIAFGTLTVPKNCLNGDTISIAASGATITLT